MAGMQAAGDRRSMSYDPGQDCIFVGDDGEFDASFSVGDMTSAVRGQSGAPFPYTYRDFTASRAPELFRAVLTNDLSFAARMSSGVPIVRWRFSWRCWLPPRPSAMRLKTPRQAWWVLDHSSNIRRRNASIAVVDSATCLRASSDSSSQRRKRDSYAAAALGRCCRAMRKFVWEFSRASAAAFRRRPAQRCRDCERACSSSNAGPASLTKLFSNATLLEMLLPSSAICL